MRRERQAEPGWDGWTPGQWATRVPGAIVPVPAVGRSDLRGRRVIVGLPGLGWRGDVRADEPVVQGSRTYVPVLAEQEWYRAEVEQTEVFAPLMPVERVWLEEIEPSSGPGGPAPDLVARLVSLDTPPRREAVPARETSRATGRRVVRLTEHGEQRDLRAVTEAYTSADGDICIRVASELEWYRWVWSGEAPKTLEVPVHLLWME